MKQLTDSKWDDHRFSFTVEVQVARDHGGDPAEAARAALAHRIGEIQTETNWDNRFAIVTRIS